MRRLHPPPHRGARLGPRLRLLRQDLPLRLEALHLLLQPVRRPLRLHQPLVLRRHRHRKRLGAPPHPAPPAAQPPRHVLQRRHVAAEEFVLVLARRRSRLAVVPQGRESHRGSVGAAAAAAACGGGGEAVYVAQNSGEVGDCGVQLDACADGDLLDGGDVLRQAHHDCAREQFIALEGRHLLGGRACAGLVRLDAFGGGGQVALQPLLHVVHAVQLLHEAAALVLQLADALPAQAHLRLHVVQLRLTVLELLRNRLDHTPQLGLALCLRRQRRRTVVVRERRRGLLLRECCCRREGPRGREGRAQGGVGRVLLVVVRRRQLRGAVQRIGLLLLVLLRLLRRLRGVGRRRLVLREERSLLLVLVLLLLHPGVVVDDLAAPGEHGRSCRHAGHGRGAEALQDGGSVCGRTLDVRGHTQVRALGRHAAVDDGPSTPT